MSLLLQSLAERPPTDIVIEELGRSVTAAELLQDIQSLQTQLIHNKVRRLALLAGNSAAWIATDLACQAADVCFLPLPPFFSDQQIVGSLEQVNADVILTDDPQRILGMLPMDMGMDLEPGAAVWLQGSGLTWVRLPEFDRKEQTASGVPENTHKITFTSGSTGSPRGVCLSTEQQILVAESLGQLLQLQAPRHLCLLPLSTLLENIGGVYSPLLCNGTVICPPETVTGFSGSTGLNMQSMLQAISSHRPTSIILLPEMLVGLVAALQDGWRPPVELEFAAVGGACVSPGLLEQARALGFPVYEGYGLSEVASVACINRPGDELIGSVGRPLPHIKLAIESGEVVLSGNSFLGYVGQPDSWGEKRVLSGDLGFVDAEGFVHISGRKKNILISSLGRNISPEWVESELLLYREIAECIVFGDDRPYCTALIAAADGDTDDGCIQVLVDGINQQLPDYARICRWHRLSDRLASAKGFYTENGRPRRDVIAQHFGSVIDSLYSESARTSAQ